MKRFFHLCAGTVLFQIVILLVAPGHSSCEMRPILKKSVGVPPFSIVEQLLRGNNEKFATEGSIPEILSAKEATPYITWLTDIDPRLHVNLIDNKIGPRILEIRNPGGQLLLSAGALDYGVLQLNTPLLLITVGSDNEALQLIQKNQKDLSAALRDDLQKIQAGEPEKTAKEKENLDEQTELLLAAERHIDRQVVEALRRYQNRISTGRLVVAGGIIDLADGYGMGAGRLFIININGETSSEKLQSMHHSTRLDQNLRRFVGRVRPLFFAEKDNAAAPHQ